MSDQDSLTLARKAAYTIFREVYQAAPGSVLDMEDVTEVVAATIRERERVWKEAVEEVLETDQTKEARRIAAQLVAEFEKGEK